MFSLHFQTKTDTKITWPSIYPQNGGIQDCDQKWYTISTIAYNVKSNNIK